MSRVRKHPFVAYRVYLDDYGKKIPQKEKTMGQFLWAVVKLQIFAVYLNFLEALNYIARQLVKFTCCKFVDFLQLHLPLLILAAVFRLPQSKVKTQHLYLRLSLR